MLLHPGVYGYFEVAIFVPVLTVGLICACRNYRG